MKSVLTTCVGYITMVPDLVGTYLSKYLQIACKYLSLCRDGGWIGEVWLDIYFYTAGVMSFLNAWASYSLHTTQSNTVTLKWQVRNTRSNVSTHCASVGGVRDSWCSWLLCSSKIFIQGVIRTMILNLYHCYYL